MIARTIKDSPSYQVDVKEYRDFINNAHFLMDYAPKIQALKEIELLKKIIPIGEQIFSNHIANIISNLQDIKVGITALDLPSDESLSPTENSFWGMVATMSICCNIFSPINEKLNGTPFTIHNSSIENEQRLKEAGLKYHSPQTVLGFHNDGVLEAQGVYVPNNLMIYNMYIGYQKPGHFHWVPFELWEKKEYFAEKVGIGKRFRIQLTPIVYPKSDGTLDVRNLEEIEAPIFFNQNDKNNTIFLNGDIVGSADDNGFNVELIENLKQSISSNPVRFSVEQKSRRAIFLKNTIGCHARDIFELPFSNNKYTRSFLRALDSEGIRLKAT